MLEPLGPLPEAVYWRRRVAAGAVLVVGLMLCLWGVTALAGGDTATRRGAPAPDRAGSPPTTSTSAPPSASSSAPPSSAPPGSTPPDPATPGGPPPGAPGTEPGGAPGEPGAGQPGPDAGAPPGPPGPPPPPPPPGPCPDPAIGLAAQPSAEQYRPGQPREFRMVVTNLGPVPCFRDLDPALQEVLVLAPDGARLWSSNDCYGEGGPAVRLLAPGEQVVSRVVWAGRTSHPGCPVQRETVPPGEYRLVAMLGPLASPPAPFRLG